MTPVQDLLKEARRLDLSSAEGRLRLGDLAEALHHELPEVVDRDTIIEAWFVSSAFPPATRRPGLRWTTYVILRFHPARHELADRAAREGWDQARLEGELAAWFAARYDPGPDGSA